MRTVQAMKYDRVAECWLESSTDRGAKFDIMRDGVSEFWNIKTRAEAEALARELDEGESA